jgi:hypothetical protein
MIIRIARSIYADFASTATLRGVTVMYRRQREQREVSQGLTENILSGVFSGNILKGQGSIGEEKVRKAQYVQRSKWVEPSLFVEAMYSILFPSTEW